MAYSIIIINIYLCNLGEHTKNWILVLVLERILRTYWYVSIYCNTSFCLMWYNQVLKSLFFCLFCFISFSLIIFELLDHYFYTKILKMNTNIFLRWNEPSMKLKYKNIILATILIQMIQIVHFDVSSRFLIFFIRLLFTLLNKWKHENSNFWKWFLYHNSQWTVSSYYELFVGDEIILIFKDTVLIDSGCIFNVSKPLKNYRNNLKFYVAFLFTHFWHFPKSFLPRPRNFCHRRRSVVNTTTITNIIDNKTFQMENAKKSAKFLK